MKLAVRLLSVPLLAAERLSEAHLLHTAMQRAGGSFAVAAAMLSLSPEALMLRLHRRGLSLHGGSAGDPPPSVN